MVKKKLIFFFNRLINWTNSPIPTISLAPSCLAIRNDSANHCSVHLHNGVGKQGWNAELMHAEVAGQPLRCMTTFTWSRRKPSRELVLQVRWAGSWSCTRSSFWPLCVQEDCAGLYLETGSSYLFFCFFYSILRQRNKDTDVNKEIRRFLRRNHLINLLRKKEGIIEL